MTNSLYPLGKVMNWIEASGFTVSYFYEELVFIESNAFLIRFDEHDPGKITFHINSECDLSNAVALEKKLIKEAKNHGLHPVKGGQFNLSQKEEEEIEILFES